MTKAHFLFLAFFKILKIISCYLYYCDFTENETMLKFYFIFQKSQRNL